MLGAETWTMTQADRERLSAYEMWIWRRMKKISWVDRVSKLVIKCCESPGKQEHLGQSTAAQTQMDRTHLEA